VLLPACACGRWYRVIDTARERPDDFLLPGAEQVLKNDRLYRATARSVVVLEARP
jgi:hypothetical protein